MSKGILSLFMVSSLLAACATAPANMDAAKKAYYAGDFSTAFPQFKELAAQGDVQAEDYLGQMYLIGLGVTQDYVVAEHWLSLAAAGGADDAEYELGDIYAGGLSGRQDYVQAMQMYRKAADQGVAMAATDIGNLYAAGLGVPQDYKAAMDWFHKGADEGDSRAMATIGDMYLTGQGVGQDYAKAISWLSRGADLKNAQATVGLAYMQFLGLGQPKDQVAAMKLYETAADEGEMGAALFVAGGYLHGAYGLAKDPVKAKALFDQAVDHEMVNIGQMQQELRAVIDAHKSYPDAAVKAHVEGKVTVSFDLPGQVPMNIRVDGTSGSRILDKAAVDALRDSTFPRRVASLHKVVHFTVTLDFTGTTAATQPSPK